MAWIAKIALILSLVWGISYVYAQNAPTTQVAPIVQDSLPIASTPLSEPSTPYILDATTTVLLDETDQARGEILNVDHQLMKAAYLRAQYFCSNPFTHFGSDGVTPWLFFNIAGYNYRDAAENLGEGYGSPQEMQDAFMNSPEHKVNIMNPKYTDIGLADLCGHVVVLFGDK